VSKLKAFVRFDGTGTIVPSSTILAKSKPKVGKWVETLAYECCNYVPTTTTTTTPIPFQKTVYVALKKSDACNGVGGSFVTAVGDGTTFCNSTTLTSSGFTALASGELFIIVDGQLRTANHGAGQNFVTFTGICDSCIK
jgi:hypothetical protein